MNFDQEVIPEWSAQYVRSNTLTGQCQKLTEIEQAIKKGQKDSAYNITVLEMMYQELESQFWHTLKEDLQKIEQFYEKELRQAVKRVDDVKKVVTGQNVVDSQETLGIIEDNITELYRGLDLLLSYCQVNASQIRQICRQWDISNKHVQQATTLIKPLLADCPFSEPEEIESLKEKLEIAFSLLNNVSAKEANERLSKNYNQKDAARRKTAAQYKTGIVGGVCLFMFLSYISIRYFYPHMTTQQLDLSIVAVELLRIQLLYSWCIIMYGCVIAACEHCHINYLFLLEIPANQRWIGSAPILMLGFTYMISICLFGTLAVSATSDEVQVPLPFGYYLKKLTVIMSPELWCLMTTFMHIVVLYYSLLGVFSGQNLGVKHFFVTCYKTLTPWAHPVSFPCFLLACLTTSSGRLLKDTIKTFTMHKVNDWALTVIAMYPSLIRLMQCIVRWKADKYHYYPHILNGNINLLGAIGQFLHAKAIVNNRTSAWFWIFFVVRVLETSGKLYWDYAEDGGLFTGGTACKPFKNNKSKWPYKWLCKRPSFFPLSWIIFHLFHNLIGRCLWMVDVLFSHTKLVKSQEYVILSTFNEIFRRGMWTVLRMDNQQLTNCENYMATKYIPILSDSESVFQITQNAGKSDQNTLRRRGSSFVSPENNQQQLQRLSILAENNETLGHEGSQSNNEENNQLNNNSQLNNLQITDQFNNNNQNNDQNNLQIATETIKEEQELLKEEKYE